jgi:hypothetical protein
MGIMVILLFWYASIFVKGAAHGRKEHAFQSAPHLTSF